MSSGRYQKANNGSAPGLFQNSTTAKGGSGLFQTSTTAGSAPGLFQNSTTAGSAPGLFPNSTTAGSAPGLFPNSTTAKGGSGLFQNSTTAGSGSGLLDYHKSVYRVATISLRKIYELANPMEKNTEPYKYIEALNTIIKEENIKNGKKENMGIIRPTNFAANWKAVKNPKYIQKFPNGKAMAIEAMQGICDLYGYPRGWSQFPPIFSDGGNSADDTAEEKYWQEAYEEMNDYFEEIRNEYLQDDPKRILEAEETLVPSMGITNNTLKVLNVEHGQPEYAHVVRINDILVSWDQAYKANKSGNNAELEAEKIDLASFCDKHGYPAAWGKVPILYAQHRQNLPSHKRKRAQDDIGDS